MDVRTKIEALGEAARYDICQAADRPSAKGRLPIVGGVYRAVRRCGGTTPILKVLQSNACHGNCAYCANRSGRDTPRVTLTPDELARAFDEMYRAHLVEGLFLSSGLCGDADRTMDRMLATVRLVRTRYAFRGYIHLKIMPGADKAAIEEACSLADRVSTNLEAPNAARLAILSQSKDFAHELYAALKDASTARYRSPGRPSMTTQFVVGAAGESDAELLQTVGRLYRELALARVYYSAFNPVPDTPLENLPPAPPWREKRLYQADALLLEYGFRPEELPYDPDGMLPRDADPKLAWAHEHPERFPIEVNRAEREDLLRIPGIGPVSAQRILSRRRSETLHGVQDLGLSQAQTRRAAPYIVVNGRSAPQQLPLF